MKALHIVGGLALLLAVAGVEGGGLNCLQGLALGMSGGALMIATMRYTGWYYE
jgi:hypothetical protein